jgi:hypothetical protein
VILRHKDYTFLRGELYQGAKVAGRAQVFCGDLRFQAPAGVRFSRLLHYLCSARIKSPAVLMAKGKQKKSTRKKSAKPTKPAARPRFDWLGWAYAAPVAAESRNWLLAYRLLLGGWHRRPIGAFSVNGYQCG